MLILVNHLPITAEVYDLIFNLSIKTKFINIVIILAIINQKCRKK